MQKISFLGCVAGCVLSLPLASGCGQSERLPTTYPVRGKVVFRQGQPAAAGTVRFDSEADSRIVATGAIQPDGSFTLFSFINRQRAPGAIAGVHRATVISPLDERQSPLYSAKLVNDKYTVAPGQNEFTLTIEQRAAR